MMSDDFELVSRKEFYVAAVIFILLLLSGLWVGTATIYVIAVFWFTVVALGYVFGSIIEVGE